MEMFCSRFSLKSLPGVRQFSERKCYISGYEISFYLLKNTLKVEFAELQLSDESVTQNSEEGG